MGPRPPALALLIPLLGALAAGCSPDYRSGETACAPAPPLCPDGYFCSGIRCYANGQVPPAGGTGGAGTGGSAAGGSGAPTPDAASDPGVGGSAGGGSGGVGGSGGAAGGTGGAGGSTPPPPNTSCGGNTPIACTNAPRVCFPPGTVCTTVVQCGQEYRACPTADKINDCGVQQCIIPAERCQAYINDPQMQNACDRCRYRKCCGFAVACANEPACRSDPANHEYLAMFLACARMYCPDCQ
jgi:hypothetical protein